MATTELVQVIMWLAALPTFVIGFYVIYGRSSERVRNVFWRIMIPLVIASTVLLAVLEAARGEWTGMAMPFLILFALGLTYFAERRKPEQTPSDRPA